MKDERILHISDQGFPDPRIERFSHLENKLGFKSYFCGNISKEQDKLSINDKFIQKYYLKQNAKIHLLLPYSYSSYKKEVKKVIDFVKPDIIQAHNFLSGKVCLDLGVPYIYNDHELWEYQVRSRNMQKHKKFLKKIQRKITDNIFLYNVKKWNKRIIKGALSVIVVSDIPEDYLEWNKQIDIIPNFPTKEEIKLVLINIDSKERIRVLLVNKAVEANTAESLRKTFDVLIPFVKEDKIIVDIFGHFPSFLNTEELNLVDYKGMVSHEELSDNLKNYDLGLMEFPENRRKIGMFKFYSPNRIFLFANAGIVPIIHKDMTFLQRMIPISIVVNEEKELIEHLEEILEKRRDFHLLRQALVVLAKKEIIFDNFLEKLEQIYRNYPGKNMN